LVGQSRMLARAPSQVVACPNRRREGDMRDSLGRIDLFEGPCSKGWGGCELSHNVLFNDAEHPESIRAATFGAV
jgi:hypothetical protein